MTAILERRLRQHRARVLIRDFEHRQRHHARGVWFRLRRLLAFARDAYAISREDADRLIAEGYQPEPEGEELSPRKVILRVPAARAAALASARALAVRLNAELLATEYLMLVPFDGDA
jgi:hypothetical protein